MKKLLAAIVLVLGMVSLGGCIIEAYPAYPHYHYYHNCRRCWGRGYYLHYNYETNLYVRVICVH